MACDTGAVEGIDGSISFTKTRKTVDQAG